MIHPAVTLPPGVGPPEQRCEGRVSCRTLEAALSMRLQEYAENRSIIAAEDGPAGPGWTKPDSDCRRSSWATPNCC